jgi:predicted metal-dependent HD superfamily phosphohydrolase
LTRPELDVQEERLRMAGLYRDLFDVDVRGQEVFDDLYKRFFAHANVHVDGGIDAVLRTYKDASRREVVQHIVNMINLAAGADDAVYDATNGDQENV